MHTLATRGLLLLVGWLAPLAQGQAPLFSELHRMLPSGSGIGTAIALGDVDADGDLDALAPHQLLLNDGFGLFTDAASPLPSVADYAQAIGLGDVDGDGDLDALIVNGSLVGSGGLDRLCLNDGSGVFTDATAQLPAVLDYTLAVALGDMDGDGDLDALLGNTGGFGGQNRLYVNDGSGVFADATAQIPALVAFNQAVALGDLDADGDLDSLIGIAAGQDRLHLNNGSGVFTDATAQLPSFDGDTTSIALGDVDGDADLDALIGDSWHPSRLYSNDGSGVFADASSQLPPLPYYNGTSAVVLGDVDGDGDLDALLGTATQRLLFRNEGSGLFADATSQLPALGPFGAGGECVLGDVDGDGDLDGLVDAGSEAGLYLNDGAGLFTDATTPYPPDFGNYLGGVELGDLDGDGDLDAFAGNVVFLNDGEAAFSGSSVPLPPYPAPVQAVALGDVDGDGDLDVLSGNSGKCGYSCYAGQDGLFLNDGSGAFTDATSQLPALFDATEAVALGDVDGDGDLDGLAGTLGVWNYWQYGVGGQDRLYLNDGSGVFTDATAQLPAFPSFTRAVAFGDVDGDGDLDALFGAQGQNRLDLNDGSGMFTDATAQLPAIPSYTHAIALGDMDGDGDLDVVTGDDGQDHLYANAGIGLFTDATVQLPSFLGHTTDVALGDVDGDGDLDAWLADEYDDRLYRNGGFGVFTDATPLLSVATGISDSVALGDLDGDGDLDAFLGNAAPDRVVLNLSRQLAWRGVPRLGKPLTLDLRGPAWGAWFLGVSLGAASIPMPPLGTLRLDPASLLLASAALLDAEGRASIAFSVPTTPSLLGQSVYWQAVVVGPARFTNLEITTLTNL